MLAQLDGTFRANSELVVAYTTVLDKEYRFVKNLHASDFRLKVDRQETAIEAFWKEDEPVSAVIVLDLSGSMKSALRPQKRMLQSLLQNALPQDEYAILLCEDPIELAVAFSSDVAKLLKRAGPFVAHGRTPLFDSVNKAVTLAREGVKSRKVVIVITDGEDTSSRLKLRELNRILAEA